MMKTNDEFNDTLLPKSVKPFALAHNLIYIHINIIHKLENHPLSKRSGKLKRLKRTGNAL